MFITRYQEGSTILEIKKSTPYKNNRVFVSKDSFPPLPKNSSLLVDVPSRPFYGSKQKLHSLVAKRFQALRKEALQNGFEIYVQKGYEHHESKYENKIDKILNEEMLYLSKNFIKISPHATGLVLDLYWDGTNKNNITLEEYEDEKEIEVAVSQKGGKNKMLTQVGNKTIIHESEKYGVATVYYQNQTSFAKWLGENMHKFGFTPLRSGKNNNYNEVWHIECLLPITSYLTGQEFTNDYGVRVKEMSKCTGMSTNQEGFSLK